MQDLISRQAAIEALQGRKMTGKKSIASESPKAQGLALRMADHILKNK